MLLTFIEDGVIMNINHLFDIIRTLLIKGLKGLFGLLTNKSLKLSTENILTINNPSIKQIIIQSSVTIEVLHKKTSFYIKILPDGNIRKSIAVFFEILKNMQNTDYKKEDIFEFQKEISNYLAFDKNFKKFCSDIKNKAIIGRQTPVIFPTEKINSKFEKLYNLFFSFILTQYKRKQNKTFGDTISFSIYNKSKATYNIAKLFNIENLISEPRLCVINLNENCYVYGCATPKLDGIISNIDNNVKINANIIKDLINLDFLDYLCVQTDHWAHNQMILYENLNPVGICCFDNASYKTFSMCMYGFPKWNDTQYIYSRIIDAGYINRPYFCENIVDKILQIRIRSLISLVNNYLSFFQVLFLILRFSFFKRCLKKSLADNKIKIINKNEWNNELLKLESIEKYGLTYVLAFLDMHPNCQ